MKEVNIRNLSTAYGLIKAFYETCPNYEDSIVSALILMEAVLDDEVVEPSKVSA